MTSLGRRDMLRMGALAGVAPLVAGADKAPLGPPAERPVGQVRRYTRLGRTGLEISDISFGSARLRRGDERLVHQALDLGVNYFDTAEGYTGGASENAMGRALAGRRHDVVLVSKTMARADRDRNSLMGSLETSLRRLRTDYLDVFFSHAVNDVARLENPEWHEFAARAKEQGKVRFLGMSGHGGRLIECLDYAFDRDMVDVVLVAYNFGQDPSFFSRFTRGLDYVARQPDLPRALEKARSRDVGVVVMKTLMGARLNDMRPYETGGTTYAQAAFRWVLSDERVHGLVITMHSEEVIDEYLAASGTRGPTSEDLALLERYAMLNGATYCRHACTECEGACPYGVPIPDIMRTRMYATDYGDPRFAREEYAKLEVNASACLGCTGQPCAGACPHEIPVDAFCAPTHRMLA